MEIQYIFCFLELIYNLSSISSEINRINPNYNIIQASTNLFIKQFLFKRVTKMYLSNYDDTFNQYK